MFILQLKTGNLIGLYCWNHVELLFHQLKKCVFQITGLIVNLITLMVYTQAWPWDISFLSIPFHNSSCLSHPIPWDSYQNTIQ